jgi:hypothetical protein
VTLIRNLPFGHSRKHKCVEIFDLYPAFLHYTCGYFIVLPIDGLAFTAAAPPVKLQVRGRAVREWKEERGSAGPVPQSPTSEEPETALTLIPYAAAKLRITAFPLLKKV